uniref:Uncharacterized protein n=1 Tax=Romanomermis culicivorax TaxID=13658 RepID=A0A915JKS8_ROMCU
MKPAAELVENLNTLLPENLNMMLLEYDTELFESLLCSMPEHLTRVHEADGRLKTMKWNNLVSKKRNKRGKEKLKKLFEQLKSASEWTRYLLYLIEIFEKQSTKYVAHSDQEFAHGDGDFDWRLDPLGVSRVQQATVDDHLYPIAHHARQNDGRVVTDFD